MNQWRDAVCRALLTTFIDMAIFIVVVCLLLTPSRLL